MSYLPETASFEERVQDYFLSLRGSGLMLGALDGELLARWAEVEAPFEVVARGIRRAAERAEWDSRPGQPLLRSLRACRREVETELRRHQRLGAGGRPQLAFERTHPIAALHLPPAEEATGSPSSRARIGEVKRARSLLSVLAASHPEVFAAAGALLTRSEQMEPEAFLSLWDREDRLVACLIRALNFGNRLGLLRTARDLVKAASPFSVAARRMTLRFHRSQLLRRHLGLPPS